VELIEGNMKALVIRKTESPAQSKVVSPNQKAIDALPLNSGTWRIEGVPGLYLRCRVKAKSFFIQRRVKGLLVKETLGELSMKRAKEKAMKTWSGMKSKPAADDVMTLGAAIEAYLFDKPLAQKTRENYSYNFERYLSSWKNRSLQDIGNDRAGMRILQRRIKTDHGPATSNQVVRLLSAVYRWQRKIDIDLPEPPTTAVEVDKIAARDWAFTPEELKTWWHSIEEKDDRIVERGVKTLGPIKRMWWLTALLTGARKSSIEALKWSDLKLEKRMIHFRVTKGDRPYAVPMSGMLVGLLAQYRNGGTVPPSEWVFPSSAIDGRHIVGVKNTNQGVGPAHRLRHTFRTTLAQIGATPDQARLLMGHSMGGDVSLGYITAPLVVESLRPITNAVAERYAKILGWQKSAN
jgi:integrase